MASLLDYLEPALAMGSAAVAEPLAGWAGLLGGGGDGVRAAREAMTYQPRTAGGMEKMAQLAALLEQAKGAMVDRNPPVRMMVDGYNSLADSAGDISPALGAAVRTLPAAAMALGGPGSASVRSAAKEVGKGAGTMLDDNLRAYMRATGMQLDAARPTVTNAQRIGFPKIYDRPDQMVAEAASRVAAEDPALQQLFGVTRDDLFNIGKQGTRQGNMTDVPYKTAANPKENRAALDVMNNKNAMRLQDIIGEAMDHPDLYKGMASWYVMDPLFDQFKRLYGDGAAQAYNKFNALTGMASPGSEVLTEMNRGTAANWLHENGRWDDFMKHGGASLAKRVGDFPQDMMGVMGHPYHSTAQAGPMDKFLKAGNSIQMDSAKVPSYIHASGVPDVGFQTDYPVADAHFSRLVGLTDTRNPLFDKGVEVLPKASASVPEAWTLTPWWREKVAEPMGLKAVPAQAVVWGAGSGATGVTSPIGAPKLELLAQQIMGTARRLGISPEEARDMVLTGKTYAGDGVLKAASLLDD